MFDKHNIRKWEESCRQAVPILMPDKNFTTAYCPPLQSGSSLSRHNMSGLNALPSIALMYYSIHALFIKFATCLKRGILNVEKISRIQGS